MSIPLLENPSTFAEIAQEVLKKSIRSAVCLDDNYASAYSIRQPDTSLNFDEPRRLHSTFREQGLCDIDIYQFTSIEDSWKDYTSYNKDLLILDWELDTAPIKHESTLKILKDVIKNNRIPFVVVYTNVPDLNVIGRILVQDFNHFTEQEFSSLCSELDGSLRPTLEDPDSIDMELFLEDIEDLAFQYISTVSKREETKIAILEKLSEKIIFKNSIPRNVLELKLIKAFRQGSPVEDSFLNMAFGICNKNSDQYLNNKIQIDQQSYKINGTTILLFHKSNQGDGISPEDLFSEFSKAIVNNPFNFLSLLALEFKDNLREDFSKIGTEFSNVNERAFFYHLSNYQLADRSFNKRVIYDFILKSWIGELYSQKLTVKSKVLDSLEDRFNELKASFPDEKAIVKDHKFLEKLVSYSAFISTSIIKGREDNTLKFGDLFVDSKNGNTFFLCITPLCDCVKPSKISNNFYFVKGQRIESYKALLGAEKGFYSFAICNDEPVCIEWRVKPFTAYIADQSNDISAIRLSYLDNSVKLTYLAIVKENYCQRIANQTFGYGYKVGVDLPHIPNREIDED